ILLRQKPIAWVKNVLNATPDFTDLDRSTVFRWRKSSAEDHRHSDTIGRIIGAAAAIKVHERTPPIKFAAIRRATEMLPVHLLEYLPRITRATEVTVEPLDTISDCFVALGAGDVDVVVAPRHDCAPDAAIQRLCKLVEIPVGGIFPGKENPAGKPPYVPF